MRLHLDPSYHLVVIPSAISAGLMPAAVLLWLATLQACAGDDPPAERSQEVPPATAEYVGRHTCGECHPDQLRRWAGSHHDLAMQEAREDTVLGDFQEASFDYAGKTSNFFRRDGGFFVRTDGPEGELQEFEIVYTFGVEPLQQYLVRLPGGRLQALSISWDSRPVEDGGGRWFHLYPEDAVDHRNVLHWTGLYQNWNHQCAECHSTNLRKRYDPETKTFDTTWSELDVSCEACHGPASLHLAWARKEEASLGASGSNKVGLTVDLSDPGDGSWVMDLDKGIARREVSRTSNAETETCGRCHSRRGTIREGVHPGHPLGDSHRVALLEDRLYHADGQIQDEVYVYGSFLQSKMYAQGVTCRDCHDTHSLRLWSPGHGVCARCHLPSRFDTANHHHHEQGTPGASCLDCHMRDKRFMVVDPRRDHSFRIPRPDLTVRLGTPNACGDCHQDRSADWAAEQVASWFGPDRPEHYGEALHAGREGLPGADEKLARLAQSPVAPGIVRATAVSLLTGSMSSETAIAVEAAAQDPDPLVRRAATEVARLLEPRLRQETLLALLLDPVRTVRIAAARALADIPPSRLPERRRHDFEAALAEYVEALSLDADRPEAHLNLGNLYLSRGDLAAAEAEYLLALSLSPQATAVAVNLADLYRVQGNDEDGERVLRDALNESPEDAALHHSLGLLLVRQERRTEALMELEKAVELDPRHTRYSVVLGVALHDTGLSGRALEVLQKAHQRRPGHQEALRTLALLHWDEGNREAALTYAGKLLALSPHDPSARQLVDELAREVSHER